MKISKSMINYYLSSVTVGWFDDNDLPPDEVQKYLPLVQDIKTWATHHGDLETLKLSFEYLLTHPEINYEEFAGGRYPYDSEEIREIIEFVYRTIWTDSQQISLERSPNVQLVQMPLEEWWSRSK